MLLSNRPLSEKSILEIPSSKLDLFVDGILGNKNISEVLFSSCADSEINLLKKSREKMKNAKIEKKISQQDNNPNDIVINRKKTEMIEDIKLDIKQYKINQTIDLKYKKINNIENRKYFHEQKIVEDYENILQLNSVRIERFMKIFNSIKQKIVEKLNDGKRKGLIYDKIPFEFNSIKLPELRLDLHDVFSRLYHNEVLLNPKKGLTFDKKIHKNSTEINNPIQKNNKNNPNEHNFKVHNVIDSANGKEFTIKITDEIFSKCFTKYSGGPNCLSDKV